MKYCQYAHVDRPWETRAGYIVNNNAAVVDVSRYDPHLPQTLIEILRNGQIDRFTTLQKKNPPTIPLTEVLLKAPVTGMDKVLGLLNSYTDTCEQQNVKLSPDPLFFNKFPSCVIGQSDPLKIRTNVTGKVDWEVEMAIVIRKPAHNVQLADACDYVLGCTIGQDITARDWLRNRNGGQHILGKSMDTFCPLGPWIVSLDELGDTTNLYIKCSVNGMLKQNASTRLLGYTIDRIVSYISRGTTLLPGDVILTGSPVGTGNLRKPPEYLRPGDVIVSEIQNIGSLTTNVVKMQDNKQIFL